MGELLHLEQRGGLEGTGRGRAMQTRVADESGRGTAQSPPRCIKCKSPPINSQCAYFHIISQPSIYIDGWLYAMSMTSVVCNVPVLSQNDSTYHHSVFTT